MNYTLYPLLPVCLQYVQVLQCPDLPHGIGKPASVQNKTRGQIGFLNMLPTLFFALPPKPMREAPQDNPQLP